MENAVGFNKQFTELQLKYAALKERCANQLEIYNHMIQVEGPNIKSTYMMLVGQLEHRVFELKTEINRWKRRFTLKQAALNAGLKPDYLAIETELDKEFAEYLTQIKQHLQEIKEASLNFHAGRMSEEESTALRVAYLDAVKRLHPDINPGLPQAAVDLWNQIQKAYEDKDWDQVKFLAGLVDGVVSGKKDFTASKDGLEELKKECEKLAAKCAELAERTEKARSTVPFTYTVLLEDEEAVAERQNQLKAQISALEECVKEYEELWNHGK